MKRLHLFEFEDKSWFPTIIRNYMTDYLQFVTNSMNFYEGIVPILKKGLAKTSNNTIVDLASGGGGGWLKLSKQLDKEMPDTKIVLSDYYPNINAFEYNINQINGRISYQKESVNALDVPNHLEGFRTMFLSFHHFQPNEAKQILENAVNSNQPIAIFEAQERSIGQLVQFFFSPIFVLLMTPLIRPLKVGRFLLTYLLPLVPMFVWWDGLVSVLRTYTIDEMLELATQSDKNQAYHWEASKIKSGPTEILYLLGIPKNN